MRIMNAGVPLDIDPMLVNVGPVSLIFVRSNLGNLCKKRLHALPLLNLYD